MESLLYQYNPWWERGYFFTHLKARNKYLNKLEEHLLTKHIVILTGLRRVGKTSLMKLTIARLISSGFTANRILYISLDDYLLSKRSILEIVDEFRRIHKIRVEEKIFLFFDEVAYKKDFQIQLKNIYDLQNAKIFVASSSASFLMDNRAYLTGRTKTLEIQPLDLSEFLAFRGVELLKRDTKLLKSYFHDYIRIGGMPENVLNPSREYLMNLVDDIIQKDITAFYGLKNHQIIRDYFTLLMERSGKQLSINKIGRLLHISVDTSKRYLNYFQATNLIHLLARWGTTNQRILSPKKVYASDIGIKYLFMGKRDLGSYFENYIYLQLYTKKRLFYLYENGVEIDFYSSDKMLIESKYYSELTWRQEQLFLTYPAKKRVLLNAVEKLQILEGI